MAVGFAGVRAVLSVALSVCGSGTGTPVAPGAQGDIVRRKRRWRRRMKGAQQALIQAAEAVLHQPLY